MAADRGQKPGAATADAAEYAACLLANLEGIRKDKEDLAQFIYAVRRGGEAGDMAGMDELLDNWYRETL